MLAKSCRRIKLDKITKWTNSLNHFIGKRRWKRRFPIVSIVFVAVNIGFQICHWVAKSSKIHVGSFWTPNFWGLIPKKSLRSVLLPTTHVMCYGLFTPPTRTSEWVCRVKRPARHIIGHSGTRQNCTSCLVELAVWTQLEIRQNCLVLSAVVFTPPTLQDNTVLSRLQLCSHRQRGLIEIGSRQDCLVGGVNTIGDHTKLSRVVASAVWTSH